MSARTAAEVADRRRDLAERDVRAGTPLQRARAYAHAMQQAPTPVRWWSWARSVLGGVTPGQVREALAEALDQPVATGPDEVGSLVMFQLGSRGPRRARPDESPPQDGSP